MSAATGTIPGPLVFGQILDSVCLVWQEKCDEKGSCWIYDTALMGQYFYILVLCVKVISITLLITAYCLYKPPGGAGRANRSASDTSSIGKMTKL